MDFIEDDGLHLSELEDEIRDVLPPPSLYVRTGKSKGLWPKSGVSRSQSAAQSNAPRILVDEDCQDCAQPSPDQKVDVHASRYGLLNSPSMSKSLPCLDYRRTYNRVTGRNLRESDESENCHRTLRHQDPNVLSFDLLLDGL
mmetsp:Transcript_13268/g.36655  ORF Transcript_13268/g.36655 Transcript_13268/m.36655 type:complete len:142 (-) Transcript_13268:78-503(-)